MERTLVRVADGPGLERVGGRGGADHFEDLALLRRVAATYDWLAETEPGRIAVLDASQTPEQVLAAALQALA